MILQILWRMKLFAGVRYHVSFSMKLSSLSDMVRESEGHRSSLNRTSVQCQLPCAIYSFIDLTCLELPMLQATIRLSGRSSRRWYGHHRQCLFMERRLFQLRGLWLGRFPGLHLLVLTIATGAFKFIGS